MKPKFSTNPNFIIQKIEGKTSIFDAEKSVLYTLNDEAAVIFRGFQLQWTKERIVKEIIIKYNIKEETATLDVDELIEVMARKKILI